MKLLIVLGLFCILQTAYTRSVREAPAPTESSLNVNGADVVKQANEAFNTLNAQFLSLWGAKDANELNTIIRNQSHTLATQFETRVTELNKLAENSQAYAQIKEFTDKVTAQVAEWKKENPETAESASKIRDNLELGLKSVTADAQVLTSKLAERGVEVNENVNNLLKNVYDDVMAAVGSLSTKIEAAADKKD